MYSNKDYQLKAIDELVSSVLELLTKDFKNKVCVFQSPTGSGKTFMVAKFIEEVIKQSEEDDLCFLWVSIGKGDLHKQSKKSLEKIFDGSLNISLLEDEFTGSRTCLNQNEVVVVNWEKLYSKYQSGDRKGEWKNKVMKDGESSNFIEVMENTKEKRKIILIIDESHYASDAERTTELREIINADVTLEMSATPKIQPTGQDLARGIAKFVYVDPQVVIEAGMIKKELIINPNISELIDDEKTSQELIIEAAFNKRIELKNAYLAEGVKINPLCLIQLPNSDAGDSKKEAIEAFLLKKGISEANGKLAIWLSEEKSDGLEVISDSKSEVDFLLFKQAIDTGWDCPRAHILVKLRDIQSYTFEVQTVGRILRMPEQKHYADETLNVGYIFTNLQSITVNKEEYNPNIIKHLKSSLKPIYNDLKLESYYKSRVDFGDITLSFSSVLENVFCQAFGIEQDLALINPIENIQKLQANGLITDFISYKEKLISDEKIGAARFDDVLGDLQNAHKTAQSIKLANNDLLDLFNTIIQQNLNGFSPKRSIPIVRGSIYQWFKKYLGINYQAENGVINIQYIFLNNKNLSKFTQILSKATGDYKPIKKEEVKAKIEEITYFWDAKKEEFFNQYTDELVDCELYLYTPCYLSANRSNPERKFEKFLETQSAKIDWWYKNGEGKKDFLGIRYEENGFPMTFYPDFIVKLKSGSVLIGDTKAGITASDATPKANALQQYLESQKLLGKNLIGGIFIEDGTGKWRINQHKSYSYDRHDLTSWDFIEDIL